METSRLSLALAVAVFALAGCDAVGRDRNDQRTIIPNNESRGLQLRADTQTFEGDAHDEDLSRGVAPGSRFLGSWRLLEQQGTPEVSTRPVDPDAWGAPAERP